MEKITKEQMGMVIANGVTLRTTRQISFDDEAKKRGEHKTVTLEFDLGGLTVMDLAMTAMTDWVVKWQNGGSGRKNYENIIDKSTIKVNPRSPGRQPEESPMETLLREAKASGVNVDDKNALTAYIAKRVTEL